MLADGALSVLQHVVDLFSLYSRLRDFCFKVFYEALGVAELTGKTFGVLLPIPGLLTAFVGFLFGSGDEKGVTAGVHHGWVLMMRGP